MKKNMAFLFFLLLIGLFVANLSGCASKEPCLAIDASLIHKGQTKDQVISLIGQPHVITRNDQGQEEWYYYHDISGFWKRMPYMGRLMGKRKIETTMITFSQDIVDKVVYYVTEQ